MGDSEFPQFGSEWHSYEESIWNKIFPLKFRVTRSKSAPIEVFNGMMLSINSLGFRDVDPC